MVNESVAQNEQVAEPTLDSDSSNEGDEDAPLNSKVLGSFTYDCATRSSLIAAWSVSWVLSLPLF